MNWPFSRAKPAERKLNRFLFDGGCARWKHLEPSIEFLVMMQEEFIVFIDRDIDVDWSYYGFATEGQLQSAEFNSILNLVAALETMPCDELQPRMKLQFKRLIGEGLARALAGDYLGAQKILTSSREYIDARAQETSRFWYLSGSFIVACLFVLLGCGFWLARGWIQGQLGTTAFWEILSTCAGAVGSLLSVIERTGKQHFDCSAGMRLHYLEAASRIFAGAISGFLVGLAVSAGLFLSSITRAGNIQETMILAAMASGISERFANSIIVDLGSTAKRPDKNEKQKAES